MEMAQQCFTSQNPYSWAQHLFWLEYTHKSLTIPAYQWVPSTAFYRFEGEDSILSAQALPLPYYLEEGFSHDLDWRILQPSWHVCGVGLREYIPPSTFHIKPVKTSHLDCHCYPCVQALAFIAWLSFVFDQSVSVCFFNYGFCLFLVCLYFDFCCLLA